MKRARVWGGAVALLSSAWGFGAATGCSASGTGGASDGDAAAGADGASTSDAAHDSSNGNDGGTSIDGGASNDGAIDSAKDTGPTCTSLVNGGTGVKACDDCQVLHCCNEFNTCWGDSDCLNLLLCASDCVADAGTGDAGVACESACEQQHQGAVPAFHAWLFCTNGSCRAECGQ